MLERLDEVRNQAYSNIAIVQKWHKTYYDNKIKSKTINANDLFLLYDSYFQKFPDKFKRHWMGSLKSKLLMTMTYLISSILKTHPFPYA